MSTLFGVDKDPRSYGQNPDVTWGGLIASFGMAFTFQAVALIVFSFLRRTFYGKQWLTPKVLFLLFSLLIYMDGLVLDYIINICNLCSSAFILFSIIDM
jgi:hypothetical protein